MYKKENRLLLLKKKDNNKSIKIYKARAIGFLFLLAFLAYGIGRNLIEIDDTSGKYIGSFLIILNSLIVLFIGVLLRRTLQDHNVLIGYFYLFTRIVESIALASIVLNLIPAFHVHKDHGYFIGMLTLGLGSIPMCLCLKKYSISPNWLAIWGGAGYAILAFGFLMEFFGKEWSMCLLVPGGLWEIAFGIWLIIKGSNKN